MVRQMEQSISMSPHGLTRTQEQWAPVEKVFEAEKIPEWWGAALQRISYLLGLPENWDSYGAAKIDMNLAYYAVQILQQISKPGIPAPSIVPTVRGHLQFEWHMSGIDLEFEVESSTKISVSFEDSLTGVEWESDLDYNLSPLSDYIKLLISRQGGLEEAA